MTRFLRWLFRRKPTFDGSVDLRPGLWYGSVSGKWRE